jgi:hypothetical protein
MFYNFAFPDASNEKMVIMIDKTIFDEQLWTENVITVVKKYRKEEFQDI